MGRRQRDQRRANTAGEDEDRNRDAVLTERAGAATGDQPHAAPDKGALRSVPPDDQPRTATEMAPGIPVGSGRGIDDALRQPDSELGGGVAGDTTPGVGRERERGEASGADEQGREKTTVRSEDRDRTTL